MFSLYSYHGLGEYYMQISSLLIIYHMTHVMIIAALRRKLNMCPKKKKTKKPETMVTNRWQFDKCLVQSQRVKLPGLFTHDCHTV